MEYTIKFKDAEAVKVVINALNQRPHIEVRDIIDSIFMQATEQEKKDAKLNMQEETEEVSS